jgi:hypothetical protein
MKRSYISTLIMAVVFALVVTRYMVYEKNLKPKQQAEDEKSKQLVSVKQDDVQEITLERAAIDSSVTDKKADQPNTPAQTVKLKKTGAEWNVVEPVQDLADSATVNALVSGVLSTKYERIVEEKPANLDDYGLKSPKLKISFKKSDASPAESVFIGRDTPVGAAIYVRTAANEAVYKVPSSLKTSGDRSLKDLRNKAVVPNFLRADLTEIEVQNAAGSVVLTKGEKDQWQLARENLPADTNEVNKLISAVLDLKATDFASESDANLKSFGLNPPKVKVTLTKGKEKEKSRTGVWFGAVKDKSYAKREGKEVVYLIDKTTLEKVDRPATAYRSLEIASFNRFDVKRIKLERGKETLELIKDDAGWNIPGDTVTKIDSGKVDSLLAKLQDSKIAKYAAPKVKIDSAQTGLSTPALLLKLYEKANPDTEKVTVKFGKADGKLIYSSRNGLDLPFLIKEEDFKRINVNKQDLVKTDDKGTNGAKAEDKKS